MAEGVGFEPTKRFWRLHTFQACAFDHSATPPAPETPSRRTCAISGLVWKAQNLTEPVGRRNKACIFFALKKSNYPHFPQGCGLIPQKA